MSEDISRLSAAFADRMRELGAGPNDPRLAPMAAQLQALFRQHVAAASNGITASVPTTEYAFQLPPALTELLRAYLATCPAQAFVQAPALSDSDAGRKLLELPAADRVRMVVAAYHAWSSNRWGGSSGGGLRRVVSDLLRAKLPLTDADAIALAESGVRDGFTYASYSPNQAILGALERHVAANGLSVGLRRTLERLRGEMNKQGAGNNVQGRKLRSGVEALLEHQESTNTAAAGNTVPLFKPKGDEWGAAIMAKLATLPGDVQGPLSAAGVGGAGRQERQASKRVAEDRGEGA